jgi:hypothetical protein
MSPIALRRFYNTPLCCLEDPWRRGLCWHELPCCTHDNDAGLMKRTSTVDERIGAAALRTCEGRFL